MSDIGAMVAELIAAGCAPEVAAKVVASAFVAGAASANVRGHPVDKTAEKRRAYDRERKREKRNSTGLPPDSAECPNTPLSFFSNRKRGERLPTDWTPESADREFAKSLGWSDEQIDSEAANFRDYWIAKPGSGGCKLDWPATWRKWVRSSKVKPAGTGSVLGPEKIPIEQAVKIFAKSGVWSRHAPINDITQAPAELLAKYGLMPDGRRVQ